MKIQKIYPLLFSTVIIFFVNILPAHSQDKNIAGEQEIKSETEIALKTAYEKKAEEKLVSEEGTNLYTTVKQGGPLMIFLLILGLISLTLIIERLIYFTKNKIWKREQVESVLREAAGKIKVKYREDMEDELKGAFQLYANGMERGMGLLSGIGNLSPIVGFLGTVIGMISAFAAIAAATTVNAKVVAVGIQIALITTAGGLTIAALSLTCYYLFSHIIQNRYLYSEEIISQLCSNLPRLSENLNEESVRDGK